MSERYYSNRDLGDESDYQAPLKQAILPDDYFAHEAVEQFILENPLIDPLLEDSLRQSADYLGAGELHPRQLDNVRGFLTAIIGFGNGRV